jgi:membrane protease YdiL (CAAX protease family)
VSTELANVDEDVSTAARALTGNERRVRWLELSLVLVIAFGGSFLSSLYVMKAGKAGLPMISEFRCARGFVQEIPCLFLLGYILSRRRKSFRDIGLRWSVRDLAVGLGLTLVSYLAYIIGGFIVYSIHRAFFPAGTSGVTAADLSSHSLLLALPFALINPFFEELIVRAYLMTEVKALTGSWLLASLSSVAIQWSYHLYYGWDASLSIAFTFLTFSIYFARTQKATPVVVAHGVLDIGAVMWWK